MSKGAWSYVLLIAAIVATGLTMIEYHVPFLWRCAIQVALVMAGYARGRSEPTPATTEKQQ